MATGAPDPVTRVGFIHDVLPDPSVLKTFPDDPALEGKTRDHDPAVALALIAVVPEVDPDRRSPGEPMLTTPAAEIDIASVEPELTTK